MARCCPSAEPRASSLVDDSSHSRSGSESATMPQPANSVASRARDDARAQRHHELAVAVAVDPAQRPGVPAPLVRLLLGDELERQLAGRAAHRGRGMQPLHEREHVGVVAQPPGHRRDQVLDVAQAARPRARGAIVQLARPPGRVPRAAWPPPPRAPRAPCRSPAAPRRARRPWRIGRAARRAGHGHGAQLPAVQADQPLGRGAEERARATRDGEERSTRAPMPPGAAARR